MAVLRDLSLRLGALVACAVALSACVKAPIIDDTCPDLERLCPTLNCVEQRHNGDGCPICECAVQACLSGDDCASGVRCVIGPSVCEPAPACTDDDVRTQCPAACFGRCETATGSGQPTDGNLCLSSTECEGDCRVDNRFCLRDPRQPTDVCFGYCVSTCDASTSFARDPATGECFEFSDSCLPPGFISGC